MGFCMSDEKKGGGGPRVDVKRLLLRSAMVQRLFLLACAERLAGASGGVRYALRSVIRYHRSDMVQALGPKAWELRQANSALRSSLRLIPNSPPLASGAL